MTFPVPFFLRGRHDINMEQQALLSAEIHTLRKGLYIYAFF